MLCITGYIKQIYFSDCVVTRLKSKGSIDGRPPKTCEIKARSAELYFDFEKKANE